MRQVAIAFVRTYQMFLGPLLPAVCRFYPSCSQYAIEALQRHGRCETAVLELWTPPEASLEDTIAKEEQWAVSSMEHLKPLFATRR